MQDPAAKLCSFTCSCSTVATFREFPAATLYFQQVNLTFQNSLLALSTAGSYNFVFDNSTVHFQNCSFVRNQATQVRQAPIEALCTDIAGKAICCSFASTQAGV